jgi:hypothetical protein
MKFTRVAGTGGPDTYGRWITEDGKFSVQRFHFKPCPDKGCIPVEPYYSVYYLKKDSRRVATDLENWSDVVDICEVFCYES